MKIRHSEHLKRAFSLLGWWIHHNLQIFVEESTQIEKEQFDVLKRDLISVLTTFRNIYGEKVAKNCNFDDFTRYLEEIEDFR